MLAHFLLGVAHFILFSTSSVMLYNYHISSTKIDKKVLCVNSLSLQWDAFVATCCVTHSGGDMHVATVKMQMAAPVTYHTDQS